MLTPDLQQGNLEGSPNIEIPGDVLRPGVEMVVEIDPYEDIDSVLGTSGRIPATGRRALDVYELPLFDVTVVPFLRAGDPESAIFDVTRGRTTAHTMVTATNAVFEDTRMLLPVDAMNVEVHEPVWTSSGDAVSLFEETEAIRTIESAKTIERGNGYWMGTMVGAAGRVGAARSPGKSIFSGLTSSAVAHAFGHALGLEHAPCGGTPEPDPHYPVQSGNIGAWGYDRRLNQLVPPTVPDLMGHCAPSWISGYHFGKALMWRVDGEAEIGAFDGEPTRVLLLWGGTDGDDGPFLRPAFVLGDARALLPKKMGRWRIVGEAEDGRELFNEAFEMAEVADGDGRSSFVFALPAEDDWADALARIVLSGPEGTAELGAENHPPMTLWRDRGTGQVRGILQGVDELPQRELDVLELDRQESRGIPRLEAWRR